MEVVKKTALILFIGLSLVFISHNIISTTTSHPLEKPSPQKGYFD